MAKTKKRSVHYVDNAKFSNAVVDYCTVVEKARKDNEEIPEYTIRLAVKEEAPILAEFMRV